MKFLNWISDWVERMAGTTAIDPMENPASAPSPAETRQTQGPMTSEATASGAYALQDVFLLEETPARPKDPACRDTVGLFLPEKEAILVRDPDSGDLARLLTFSHAKGLKPLIGRFGPDGQESVALYDPQSGAFRIWASPENPEPDQILLFGPGGLGWIPVIGDWAGTGRDGLGLYCPETSTFLLKERLEGGDPDRVFMFGVPAAGWQPMAGDWDGDGRFGIGLFDPKEGVFYLRNTLSGGEHEIKIHLSLQDPGLVALAGDWEGSGISSPAVFDPRDSQFHTGQSSAFRTEWTSFTFGTPGTAAVPMRLHHVRDAAITPSEGTA